ncbi:MAG: addiction module protein [Pseudomonadota bacterium]
MSVAQKLQIMEDLWDSLRTEQEIDPPNWHEEVLADRTKNIQNGTTTFITLEELKRKR